MVSFLRKVLFNNIPLKIIALALSFLVWYIIGLEITDRLEMRLRVQVSMPPGSVWKIVGPASRDVMVTARGPYSDVQRLRTLPWPLSGSHVIDPFTLPTGEDEIHIQVPVTVRQFHLPLTEVKFSDFKPKALDIRLARMEEKTLRVRASLEGEVGEGYVVAETPVVSPTEVRVRGPRGALRKLDVIDTLPVILTGRTSSFTEKKRVQTRVGKEDLECDKIVTVNVTVREKPGRITLKGVPVEITYPPDFPYDKYRIKLHQDAIEVIVEGPRHLLAKVDLTKIRLTASVRGKVEEDDFKGKGASINANAVLRSQLSGFSPEEHARFKVLFVEKENERDILFAGKDDFLYAITRLEKK
ncbi:MAG: CdaR family protein [Planctomycetota bacterium]|jgi:hypothetical protein